MSKELNGGLIKAIEKALDKITVLTVHMKKKGNKTKYVLDIFRRRKSLTDINKQLHGLDKNKTRLN